jgi:hypothetical protein
VKVLSTSKTSINLQAQVNFTNPTDYTAHIPFINIHILKNGSVIGDATLQRVDIVQGNNTNILVQATWDPTTFGGKEGAKIGGELLSQYISGFNTTLVFQTHEGSIPSQPELGKALSKFAIEMRAPKLSGPSTGDEGDDDDGDDKPHFINNAVFHLFSQLQFSRWFHHFSTARFILTI